MPDPGQRRSEEICMPLVTPPGLSGDESEAAD